MPAFCRYCHLCLFYTLQNSKREEEISIDLSYFELLSPAPVSVPGVGGIISPRLKDISSIGINTYQYYLTVLLLDLRSYFAMIGREKDFELLSEEERIQLNLFDLLNLNPDCTALLQTIFNFFIQGKAVYSREEKAFLIQKDGKVTGCVSRENYPRVCSVICQRSCVRTGPQEDLSKVKSKKALEIMQKLRKGRAAKSRQPKADQNLELGNIISAVANKSHSLNILNIWDLTVFQLWDCFSRLSANSIYEIQSMSVAAWGNKDNYFDASAWFKRIDTGN